MSLGEIDRPPLKAFPERVGEADFSEPFLDLFLAMISETSLRESAILVSNYFII